MQRSAFNPSLDPEPWLEDGVLTIWQALAAREANPELFPPTKDETDAVEQAKELSLAEAAQEAVWQRRMRRT